MAPPKSTDKQIIGRLSQMETGEAVKKLGCKLPNGEVITGPSATGWNCG